MPIRLPNDSFKRYSKRHCVKPTRETPGQPEPSKEFPKEFIEDISEILGEETQDFLDAMKSEPPVSVRINPRKPGASFDGKRKVLWCENGFYLDKRPVFTFDPLLHAGAYYVQDASSMIHETVLKIILGHLEKETERKHFTILDLCAAPGGKTTAMINAMPDGCEITANEINSKRYSILKENLAKWGYPLTNVVSKDSRWFVDKGLKFDVVAVDAPCSGEGMMRKDPFAIKQWNRKLVESCASLQKDILSNAIEMVNPGGFMIFSTCTFNRKENEENVDFIDSIPEMESFDLEFPKAWNIKGGIETELPVYRFMPHKTEGEGLFLAVFKKEGELPEKYTPVKDVLFDNSKDFSKKDKGSFKTSKTQSRKDSTNREKGKGKIKEVQNIPEIETILSSFHGETGLPEVELTREEAILYLKRQSLILPGNTPKGLLIVKYNGLPLGLVNNIGSRANNLYPKNWRILTDGPQKNESQEGISV